MSQSSGSGFQPKAPRGAMKVPLIRSHPTLAQLRAEGRSMTSGPLPADYDRIDSASDALKAALPVPENIVLRLVIVWDCPADELNLSEALEIMRSYGAAMVVSVEQVKE